MRIQLEYWTTEGKMVGWHHWLKGRESEQVLGDGEGQESLTCCSPPGHKESDTTEWRNNNKASKTEFTYLFCYILLLLFSCSVVSNSLRPHGLQHARFPCPSLSPRVSLNFMSIESVMLFNHLILSSPSPPAFSLSQHRVFSNELAFHIRWPKCWSFSFSISSSNEYSGLISFRINWFDLLSYLLLCLPP